MASSELPGLGQSYGKDSSNVQLVDMPWTYGNGYMLDFIKLKMGSARIDNFGSDGTLGGHSGDGTPFDVTLCIDGNPAYSATCRITTAITNVNHTTTGNYPDKSQCEEYTFKFKSSPIYDIGDTLNIIWTNRNDLTDSIILGQILTIDSGIKWKAKQPSYTVKWYQNYNDNDNIIIRTDEVLPGESITDIPEPTREGYTFIGWQPDNGWANVNSDVSIYAQWKKQSAHIWRYDKSKGWEKVISIKIYNNGVWSDLTDIHYYNNGWD